MRISFELRQAFTVFMRQEYPEEFEEIEPEDFPWKKPFIKKGVSELVIYGLQTELLKGRGCKTFYIGYTSHVDARKEKHVSAALPNSLSIDEIYRELEAKQDYKKARRKIIGATRRNNPVLDLVRIYKKIPITPFQRLATSRGILAINRHEKAYKSYLADRLQIALEKERRMIFYGLQKQYPLVNFEAERVHMVAALRAHLDIAVLTSPFEDPAWDPVVAAFVDDAHLLAKQHELPKNYR